MIGSLMSRMADAQKMSVAQIQQSIQNGSLPAYIGIPLIQDKLKQAQGSAPQPTQQPPIAQEILAKADQMHAPTTGMLPQTPVQGVESLPSNLPAQGMAEGGIVNFASGGYLDDEDEEEDDYGLGSKHDAMLQQMLSETVNKNKLLSALPKSVQQAISSLPKSYDVAREEAGLPSVRKGTTYVEKPTGKGIKDIIATKAEEQNLPPELLNRIAGVESGYKTTAANPLSSAKGLFQFTNATWKGMGGKEGEQFNPEMNAELGARYVRQNAEGLKKTLGRNPTYGEVYASHMFGLKGAKDLFKLDPRTPMENAVSDNVLRANPQLKNKTVGDVLSSLNAKTGEGVVSLLGGGLAAAPYYGFAEGGEVKHYANTGLVTDDVYDPMGGAPMYGESSRMGEEQSVSKMLNRAINPNYVPFEETEQAKPKKFTVPPSTKEVGPTDAELGRTTAEKKAETKGEEEAKAPNPFDEYLAQLKEDRAAAKKQKSINNYMALLQAGLGMMGGTSPYALANIGHGAMAGIQGLAESQKTAAAEKAALDKAHVAAMHYKEYGDIQRANQLTKEERMALAKQKDIALARDDYAQYQKNLSEEFLKNNPMAAINPDDPKVKKARDEFYAKHAAVLESLKKAAYPNLPNVSGVSETMRKADEIVGR